MEYGNIQNMIVNPLISVVLITYNQKDTVGKALNSILSQKIDFAIEILIADDASRDGTQEIIKKYKDSRPDIIRLFLNEKNIKGTRNAYQLLMKTRGKYIASLEGDDYWIDERYLEKASHFLNIYTEYIAICYRSNAVDEYGKKILKDIGNKAFWMYDKKLYTIKDFAEWKMPGHCSAMVYRNIFKLYKDDYSIFYKVHPMIGDRTILMMLTALGDIYCARDIVFNYVFRESGDGKNWMSEYQKRNGRFEEYRLICDLNEYLRKHYHIDIEMTRLLRDKIAAAAIYTFKNNTQRNRNILRQIVYLEGKPFKSYFIVCFAILQKVIFTLIGQPDRRVKV